MPKTVDATRLYSVESAAKQLDVGRTFIYDRIKDGSLTVVELGTSKSKQRIRADVLQAFIDERTFGASLPSERRAS